MVGIGFAMLGIGLWSLLRRLQKDRLYQDRWLHRAALLQRLLRLRPLQSLRSPDPAPSPGPGCSWTGKL